MSETLPNVTVPPDTVTDLYAESGVAVGEQIDIAMTGQGEGRIYSGPLAPAMIDNSTGFREIGQGDIAFNDAGDLGAFIYSRQGCQLNVRGVVHGLRWYYDFDGVGAQLSGSIPIVPGDTLYAEYKAELVNNTQTFLLDTTHGTRVFFAIYDTGRFVFSGGITAYLDGNMLSNNISVAPTDGLRHELRFEFSVTTIMTHICAFFGGSATWIGDAYNFKLNDGAVYDYPVDDGPSAGGVVANKGTGPDLLLLNEVAGDWYEAPV